MVHNLVSDILILLLCDTVHFERSCIRWVILYKDCASNFDDIMWTNICLFEYHFHKQYSYDSGALSYE
jgi:hypothetical protein